MIVKADEAANSSKFI